MSVLMIKRNIRERGVGLFNNFAYTGKMQYDMSQGYAQIKFLTSGTLTVEKDVEVDAFLVGGGAAGEVTANDDIGLQVGNRGGNGGETKTQKGITVAAGKKYDIVIGEGGKSYETTTGFTRTVGGTTRAFGYFAIGGDSSYFNVNYYDVGSGGGGRGFGREGLGGDGGDDGEKGGNGSGWASAKNSVGKAGQGTTTRAFGETNGQLYAGGGAGTGNGNGAGRASEGGGGGMAYSASGTALGINRDALENTGGGGCGARAGAAEKSGNGGSGIVIIRKAVH